VATLERKILEYVHSKLPYPLYHRSFKSSELFSLRLRG